MNGWDAALVAAVTGMVTVMAVLRTPRSKAWVLVFPVPFTLASLAVGTRLDATHVAATGTTFLYTFLVWFAATRLRVPLVAAIAVAVASFLAVGTFAHAALPRGDAPFWWAVAAVTVAGAVLHATLPVRDEIPRTRDLPIVVKVPLAALVVLGLVAIKGWIGGFMTMFPMVGVIASIENREGLWSNVRRIPVVMVTMMPLMVTARLTEPHVGLFTSLAIGWLPFLVALAVMSGAVGRWRPRWWRYGTPSRSGRV